MVLFCSVISLLWMLLLVLEEYVMWEIVSLPDCILFFLHSLISSPICPFYLVCNVLHNFHFIYNDKMGSDSDSLCSIPPLRDPYVLPMLWGTYSFSQSEFLNEIWTFYLPYMIRDKLL